jgi:hypothetical protein
MDDMKTNEKTKKSRYLKGQAAMEYLMTYGWAILVILIVLVILGVYLNQFLRAPESCIFGQAGFTCSEQRPTIYVDKATGDVMLAINIFNGQGKSVEISDVLCSTAPIGDVDRADAGADAKTIGAGASKTFTTVCRDANGDKMVVTPGSDFRGSFVFWYRFANDVDVPAGVDRQSAAAVSGPVLEQT